MPSVEDTTTVKPQEPINHLYKKRIRNKTAGQNRNRKPMLRKITIEDA